MAYTKVQMENKPKGVKPKRLGFIWMPPRKNSSISVGRLIIPDGVNLNMK